MRRILYVCFILMHVVYTGSIRKEGYYNSEEGRYYLPSSLNYIESDNYHLIKDTLDKLLNKIDTSAMKKNPWYKREFPGHEIQEPPPGAFRDIFWYGYPVRKYVFKDDHKRNITIGFLNDSTLYVENYYSYARVRENRTLCFIDIYRASVGRIDSLIATTRKDLSQNCNYRKPCEIGYNENKVHSESEIFPILKNEKIYYNIAFNRLRIREFMFSTVDDSQWRF